MTRKKRKILHLRKRKPSKRIQLFPDKHGSIGEEFIQFAKERYVGQPRIIEYIATVLDRVHIGYQYKKTPIAVVLLVGCPGTGKTFFMNVLADFLHDDPDAFLRINGPDFEERHSISKLFNSPPGYIGSEAEPPLTQKKLDEPQQIAWWQKILKKLSPEQREKYKELTKENDELYVERYKTVERLEKINDQDSIEAKEIGKCLVVIGKRLKEIHTEGREIISPYVTQVEEQEGPGISLMLVDEVDRAHKVLHDALLGIMSEGVVNITRMSRQETVVFNRTILVLTSNLGSDELARMLRIQTGQVVEIGFTPREYSSAKNVDDMMVYKVCKRALEKFFPPEFLRRIDKMIATRPFSREQLDEIFDIQLKELRKKYDPRGSFFLTFHITPEVKDFVVNEATDHPELGASLLSSKFEHYIENPLDNLRASGQIDSKDIVYIDMGEKEGKLCPVFSKEPPEKLHAESGKIKIHITPK